MRKAALFICAFLPAAIASAHQPKAVFDDTSSESAPFVVNKPEVSQAFYGRLKGRPDYYVIDSRAPFRLYLNILSPAVEGARQDYSVALNGARVIGADGPWKRFYEPYAGDAYWMGPEFERDAGPGRYMIEVSNPGDRGEYVLAVGTRESFTPGESLATLLQLPGLKTRFFGKPILAVYEGRIGKFLLALTLLAGAAVFVVLRALRRKKDRAAGSPPAGGA